MASSKSEQLQLKKLLVDLEDEHKHLQASISHLKNEIEKREIDISKLKSERELELVRQNSDLQLGGNIVKQTRASEAPFPKYSSDFTKQVAFLLENITKTSEEISALVKL